MQPILPNVATYIKNSVARKRCNFIGAFYFEI